MTLRKCAVLGVSIGLTLAGVAYPAFASADTEPLEGEYLRTITDDGGLSSLSRTDTVTFTPCGPDCTHWDLQGGNGIGFNLYRQGNQWIRLPDEESICIIDADTLQGTAALTNGISTYMKFFLTKLI